MEAVQTAVVQMGIGVAVALIGLLGAYATKFIQKQTARLEIETELIQDEKRRSVVREAIDRLEDVAYKTVNKLQRTSAKAIRQAAALEPEKGGYKEQLQALALDAAVEIKSTLEPEYVACLVDTLGDFDTYLQNVIEDQLVKVKAAKE